MTAINSPFDERDYYTKESFPDANVPFEHFQTYIGELVAESKKSAILIVEKEHYEKLQATENFQYIDRVFWGSPSKSGLSAQLQKKVSSFEKANRLSTLRSETRYYERELVPREYYVVDKTAQDITAEAKAIEHLWCGPEFPYMVRSYYESTQYTGFYYMEYDFQSINMKDSFIQAFKQGFLYGRKADLATAIEYRDGAGKSGTQASYDALVKRFIDNFQDGQSFWYYRT